MLTCYTRWASYVGGAVHHCQRRNYRLSMHANPHPSVLCARLMGEGRPRCCPVRQAARNHSVLCLLEFQALIRRPDYRSWIAIASSPWTWGTVPGPHPQGLIPKDDRSNHIWTASPAVKQRSVRSTYVRSASPVVIADQVRRQWGEVPITLFPTRCERSGSRGPLHRASLLPTLVHFAFRSAYPSCQETILTRAADPPLEPGVHHGTHATASFVGLLSEASRRTMWRRVPIPPLAMGPVMS